MSSQNYINAFVKTLFTLQLTNKLYHWNTTYYSRHKASDSFNDSLQEYLDKFVEVFIGRYLAKPMINNIKIDISSINDDTIIQVLEDAKKYLESMEKSIKDTDLLNIRDELLASINQTLYLFQLK